MSIEAINDILWVAGNVLALLTFLFSAAAAILYPVLFDVRLTTAGRVISRAILSVAAFSLLVVIGLFVDGPVQWHEYPPHVDEWRPLVRILVYGFIVISFGSLIRLLVVRRFWPEKLKTAPRDPALTEVKTP